MLMKCLNSFENFDLSLSDGGSLFIIEITIFIAGMPTYGASPSASSRQMIPIDHISAVKSYPFYIIRFSFIASSHVAQ